MITEISTHCLMEGAANGAWVGWQCNLGDCGALTRLYNIHWGLSAEIYARCKCFQGLDTPFPPKILG